MNREFVKKIIKAKIIEYEAFKEIIPESILNKVDKVEKEIGEIFQEVALERLSKSKAVIKKEGQKVKRIGVDFK